MNRFLAFLIISLALVACRSTRKLPEGSPAPIKLRALLTAVEERENSFDNLRLRYHGSYDDGSSSQDFKLEVRIAHDSLIWVDLADPLLGIKVARAIITPDSVAFVNRLQREYLRGNVSKLQQKFKIDLGFQELQALLSANTIFETESDFELYYRPGAYVLSDFNLDEQDDPAQYSGRSRFRQIYLDPQNLKPSQQMQNEPTLGKRYQLSYKHFDQQEGLLYPETIILDFLNQSSGKLELELRSLSANDSNLNYPFNIPSGYAEMR